MQARLLTVIPNPYCALDADGRAQGVVQVEGTVDLHVGAVLDIEESQKTGKRIFKIDQAGEVTVPLTAYYLRRLRDHEIVAANEPTARAAQMDFSPPAEVLASARADAAARFFQATGFPPAFLTPSAASAQPLTA